jgi:hypothetical protein
MPSRLVILETTAFKMCVCVSVCNIVSLIKAAIPQDLPTSLVCKTQLNEIVQGFVPLLLSLSVHAHVGQGSKRNTSGGFLKNGQLFV